MCARVFFLYKYHSAVISFLTSLSLSPAASKYLQTYSQWVDLRIDDLGGHFKSNPGSHSGRMMKKKKFEQEVAQIYLKIEMEFCHYFKDMNP